jgi:hypothetical protein
MTTLQINIKNTLWNLTQEKVLGSLQGVFIVTSTIILCVRPDCRFVCSVCDCDTVLGSCGAFANRLQASRAVVRKNCIVTGHLTLTYCLCGQP